MMSSEGVTLPPNACYHALPDAEHPGMCLYAHWNEAKRRCNHAHARLCTVNELSEVTDGGGYNLNGMRVWTSIECTGTMPHPHHPDKQLDFLGHFATSASAAAVANDECVPEMEPMAVLCCADLIGIAPAMPPAPLSPPKHPHHHTHHEPMSPPGPPGSGPIYGGDSSSGGGGTVVIVLILICAISGGVLWLRKKKLQQQQDEKQPQRDVKSTSDVNKIASSMKRAGGRAKHQRLRDEPNSDRDSVELTEAALDALADGDESVASPPQTASAPSVVDDDGLRRKTQSGASRGAQPTWEDDDLPPSKAKAHESAAVGFDVTRL